ncbi:MAG TPA: D-isomer specific 2-hydroxyacid dehydrogenase family protein [Micropepsaceae bacterium]|nr:D-isomer specific 2-hydroxyacid dehydrogenase family protein [Micropepsaceae bacterium]
MIRILVESDHFLKILAVMLDPETPDEHRRAVADFFAHDVPDFLSWCEKFAMEIPGLYPARVTFAQDQADFEGKLPDADAVIVESFTLDRNAVAKLKPAAIVQKFGGILSNIDSQACRERRLTVLSLPRQGNVLVAEQAFALMMALAKDITRYDGIVAAADLAAAGHPVRPYDRRYTGGSNYARIPALRALAGSQLGIVGLGEVGREIAARANAFGMRVVYHQRTQLPALDELTLGARFLALEELMAQSDYIVVQLPLNDSTQGIIGRKALQAVKPGAMLINTARAALVDREALLEALDSGRLAGVGMDVGYSEPWAPDDPLLKYKDGNVILMPHTAVGDRRNGLADLAEMCRKIWRVLDNRRTGRRGQ